MKLGDEAFVHFRSTCSKKAVPLLEKLLELGMAFVHAILSGCGREESSSLGKYIHVDMPLAQKMRDHPPTALAQGLQ